MKIIFEKSKCIGCGNCISICPKFFEFGEDGKSHLKNSKFNAKTEIEELEINKSENCLEEAIKMCPVQCIKKI